jgi:hypothetical protein
MPSIDDVFNELQKINTNLQTVEGELTQINTTLSTGFSNVLQSMQTLITLEIYSDQALDHLSKQSDTIICILEKISQQSCAQLNEAHTQTGLQTAIQKSSATLLELYKFTNPAAALEFERLEHLRKQLEECCPPSKPEPFCAYEPCEAPPPLGDPPTVGTPIS